MISNNAFIISIITACLTYVFILVLSLLMILFVLIRKSLIYMEAKAMVEDKNNNVEVLFSEYCNRCEYKDTDENSDPCDECLDNPTNADSVKPVNFKEKQ